MTAKKPPRKNSKQSAPKTSRKKAASLAASPEGPAIETDNFPIVGIGASAGGLEAFEVFFQKMPPDQGIAFVVVSHLDPSHSSMLVELIGRYTKMPVEQAKDETKIKPDHVYVIPPNKYLSLHYGRLFLSEPVEVRGFRMPIDFFFRSLAENQGDRAVCIILSGTGTDGSIGLSSIREAGGMSMVQSEDSARYMGMPRSAIATGLVDYVLPVERMPEQLINYLKVSHSRHRPKPEEVRGLPLVYQKILSVVRAKTGHDFALYKKSTIQRRIERRMYVHETNDAEVYHRYLQEHPEEISLLFKELLISVTNFFRDPEAYTALKEKVFPAFLQDKSSDYQVRIWVPGCATGEEVYSIAIVLREYMDEVNRDYKVQIFGTDIDEDTINVARTGFYPSNIAIDVSAERLRRFFVKEEDGFRIKKELRESVVFALQNVIRDAPFTKLDLVSCRNLLIYFDAELQNRIIPLFHYSLKPGGVLFLGSSESIGSHADLFTVYDKRWKFYRRKETLALHPPALGALPWTVERGGKEAVAETKPKEIMPSELARKVLENFMPPSVLVNAKGDILHVQGRTGKYLEPAPGTAVMNVIGMAREGLQMELRAAIHNVSLHRTQVVYRNLRVRTNGEFQSINLRVVPVPDTDTVKELMLVIFEDVAEVPEPEEVSKKKGGSKQTQSRRRITELERDLKYTRESLQATIEELQASNEELKSANEELQSTNEELQSTNEELETSKEEMQSVNEELATVNSELQLKIEQLSRAENDMRNLLDSTNIGIVFLDGDLRLKRFTSEATKVINLIPSDIGRPISHIVTNLDYSRIVEDSKQVLKTLNFFEAEVHTRDNGTSYLMRIMPYRTVENVIDGVAITFTDINKVRK